MGKVSPARRKDSEFTGGWLELACGFFGEPIAFCRSWKRSSVSTVGLCVWQGWGAGGDSGFHGRPQGHREIWTFSCPCWKALDTFNGGSRCG